MPELRDLTPAEKILLTKSLAASLEDPESAQFKWAKFPKEVDNGSVEYCAQVSAKNSSGEYNDFSPFIGVIFVARGKITGGGIAGIDSDPRYRGLIATMCWGKGLDPFAVS